MARQMVMARKGVGRPNEADEPSDSRTPDSRDPGASDSGDETVTCPQCGCEFDPADTDDAEAPKGADLAIALGEPDEQAPAGTEAMTNALAKVLSASRGGA